jgi:hypothetical protein
VTKSRLKRIVASAIVLAVMALVLVESENEIFSWLALRNPEQMAAVASQEWVQSDSGSMPLVILVPHGGKAKPRGLPDRSCDVCLGGEDTDTGVMAERIANAIEGRIGRRPFVVRNLLHRGKFDANRDIDEAVSGVREVVPVWERWHQRIDEAKQAALATNTRALVIDLHGHAHDVQRIELGYLIRLRQGTPGEMTPVDLRASSIAQLVGRAASGDGAAALLRGPRALGTLLAEAGFPAVPSASDPAPKSGEQYYSGGYNVVRHGSLAGGNVDAIQMELNYEGLLGDEASQARFAEAFAGAVIKYLSEQYGWTPQ